MNKTLIQAAFALAFGSAAFTTHAATLYYGDRLTINPGVAVTDSNGTQTNVSPGSWFGIDFNGDSAIAGVEKTALAQGTTGIVIGVATTAGASHSGEPTVGDTNAITAPWSFLGNTGSDYTTIGITGSTTAGLNMSGWTVSWNSIPAIPMGGIAWGTGYSSGIGNFAWDGVYGHSYTLDYHATVPHGDPSGFGDVKYALHLEGVVAVPEASTWGMMLAGLCLVGVAARVRPQGLDA